MSGIRAVNAFGQGAIGHEVTLDRDRIPIVGLFLLGYAVVVSLAIGTIAALSPVLFSHRTNPLEVLTQ